MDNRTRRPLVAALLRSAVFAAVPVVWYFVAPLDRRWTAFTMATIVVGLVLVVVLVAWQVRAVARSPHPRLRAVAALATSAPILVVLFATAYFLMARDDRGSFSESLTRVDALYYAMSVFSTVGFGDIAAQSQAARVAATVQMLADLVYVGVLVRAVMAAASMSTR